LPYTYSIESDHIQQKDLPKEILVWPYESEDAQQKDLPEEILVPDIKATGIPHILTTLA
jgi:hypothetical protein